MPKSPEQFDFSKLEGQQKFEKLPKKEREKFVESQAEEGHAINDLVSSGVAGNFERADEILSEYKKSPDFSFEELSGSLEKVKDFKEKIQTEFQKIKEYQENLKRLEQNKDNLESNRELLIRMAKQQGLETEEIEKLDNERLTERVAGNIAIEKAEEFIGGEQYNKIKEERASLKRENLSVENGINALRKQKDRGPEWEREWDDLNKKREQIRERGDKISSELEILINKKSINDDNLRLVTTEALGLTYDGARILYESPRSVREFKDSTKAMEIDMFTADGRYSDGDTYIGYKDGVWEKARGHVIKEYGSIQGDEKTTQETLTDLHEQEKLLKEKLTGTEENKKDLEVRFNGYSELIKCGNPIKNIEDLMPWVIKFVGKENPAFVKVKPRDGVVVMLNNESHYYGSGGCEYGVTASIIRNEPSNKDSKYYKWRDPYDQRKDDRRFYFDRIEILKVEKDSVEIKLINPSEKFEKTLTLNVKEIEKPKAKEALTEEEQKTWKRNYNGIREKLVEDSFLSNAIMPDYINYEFFEGTLPSVTSTGRMVSYERPRVVEEYVDETQGVAAVIIKSQIDHAAGRGKQYKWEGYIIDKNGNSRSVWSDNAYELYMRQGKRIEMKAADLSKLAEKK